MKPYIHAKIAARKYGGTWKDYMDIEEWFDHSKSNLPDMRHRMLLHNSFGIYLCAQLFGDVRVNSDGKEYSVRDVAEDHVTQDLGFIPTVERCFAGMPLEAWMGGAMKKSPKKVIEFEQSLVD